MVEFLSFRDGESGQEPAVTQRATEPGQRQVALVLGDHQHPVDVAAGQVAAALVLLVRSQHRLRV